ncbi:uncharacterized protein PpBr36_11082 [Pyricularia pennisetigena]|uniref:uncharacterized protein n=1 Tax=Pyricularia pennisetigena TaxID=1578925 RepID=UPI00114E7BFD|nr:uncharacterized protein PpBr36_11082 [Pyricularia pennisetigena]TLS20617.1 hypothetical protein PpBr36_11082 [Pyricularia pennisetigena]
MAQIKTKHCLPSICREALFVVNPTMYDNHRISDWIESLPVKALKRKRCSYPQTRPSDPPTPPATQIGPGNVPPVSIMNTPPTKRQRNFPSRQAEFDEAEQTPRPTASTLRSNVSLSYSTSSRTSKRSSSPRKRQAELEVEPEEAIQVRSLANGRLPDELFSLVSELEKVASGDAPVLHASLKQELKHAEEEAKQRRALGYRIPESAFTGAEEDTTADVITDVPAARVCEVLLAALRCQERKHDENGWNQAVHYRLLRLALPADGFVGFEPCTTARITPEILPRSSSSGKKVDYCFIVNGTSIFDQPAMEGANRTGACKTPAQAIETLRRRTPGTSINHTDFGPLNKWPIAVSVETKRPGESGEKAELQVGVWQAAQWRLLEWQRQEQQNKLQIPPHLQRPTADINVEDERAEGETGVRAMSQNVAAVTAPNQTSIPPKTPDLVFLPALIIVGHDWKFAATTREDCDGGRTILWTESTIGSTSNLFGIYRIIWCVRRLARYVEERYWPWYAEHVLGLRLEAERLKMTEMGGDATM